MDENFDWKPVLVTILQRVDKANEAKDAYVEMPSAETSGEMFRRFDDLYSSVKTTRKLMEIWENQAKLDFEEDLY